MTVQFSAHDIAVKLEKIVNFAPAYHKLEGYGIGQRRVEHAQSMLHLLRMSGMIPGGMCSLDPKDLSFIDDCLSVGAVSTV